jgi:hypothetical protein
MPSQIPTVQRVIGVEEHVWTADLRDALLKLGGDDSVTLLSSRADTDRRLRDVGDERLSRMAAAGVDLQVLSVTTPGTQSLPPAEAVALAGAGTRTRAWPRSGSSCSGTFDRHPDLQVVLGHWGEMLVPFADRADLLSAAATHLERRILDYITANLTVTAGGILSHRMMAQAVDVLGPDRVMFGADDPYGSAGYTAAVDAREFVETAPISAQDKAKFAHANAERLLGIPAPARTEPLP